MISLPPSLFVCSSIFYESKIISVLTVSIRHKCMFNFLVYFHSAGSSADIMKVGGYKLSALEIESIILEVIFG